MKTDYSKFTTASEFGQAYRAIPYPRKPVHPLDILKRENYGSEADFLRAKADALDDSSFEKVQMPAYMDALKAHQEECHKLGEAFRQWWVSYCGLENLPDDLINEIDSLAYEQGHSGGHEEVFSAIEDLADLAKKAYERGMRDALEHQDTPRGPGLG